MNEKKGNPTEKLFAQMLAISLDIILVATTGAYAFPLYSFHKNA
jgi:hypothetical protein